VSIVLLNAEECERMREAGQVAAATLAVVAARIRPGISTADIDRWVREDTEQRGARPSQLGYHGFPAAVCTSRNEVVCHGIPSETEILQDGDIINVDVTSEYNGFHGDTSRTVVLGTPTPDKARVVDVCRRALRAGIEQVRPGARLGDVGAAIEELARAEGCGTVRQFGGHGIGRKMHLPPHVGHHGPRGRGLKLRPGMAFTIEPMITIGNPKVVVTEDGWRAITLDGSPTAQFEHTILVTEEGFEILTLPPAEAEMMPTDVAAGA
jgi:methionyl aminopeptidase